MRSIGRGATPAALRELAQERPQESLAPPEPSPSELILRGLHDWSQEADPLLEADPESDEQERAAASAAAEEGPQRREQPEAESQPAEGGEDSEERVAIVADPAQLTPQGRYRASVTEDPDFKWERPDATRILTRSSEGESPPGRSAWRTAWWRRSGTSACRRR
jgi:hypothetical protein